jgi:hypothetical protein
MDEKMEEGIKHKLTITFDGVREKNIEQLRILNQAIFPINYQEQVYKDILACGDITQLAYHNDVLVGAVACRLEKSPEVSVRACLFMKTNGCTIVIIIYIFILDCCPFTTGTKTLYHHFGGVGSLPRVWRRQSFIK